MVNRLSVRSEKSRSTRKGVLLPRTLHQVSAGSASAVHHLVHAGTVFGTTRFPALLFARLFVELPATEFLLHAAVFHQLAEPPHCILNRFIIAQTQSNHKFLPGRVICPNSNVSPAIRPGFSTVLFVPRTVSISTFAGTASWAAVNLPRRFFPIFELAHRPKKAGRSYPTPDFSRYSIRFAGASNRYLPGSSRRDLTP